MRHTQPAKPEDVERASRLIAELDLEPIKVKLLESKDGEGWSHNYIR